MRTHDAQVRSIAPRRVERLGRLRGRRIACLAGTAWLTLDRDRRDIVLRPGESFLVDADAQVLACALDDGPALLEVAARRRRRGRSESIRLSAWSIAAVCAGFATFGLFELWRTLIGLSTRLQREG